MVKNRTRKMCRRPILFTFVLFVLCSIALSTIDVFIKNEITPLGIVSFEFISSLSNVNAAMQLWGEKGQAAVGFSLGLDYLYILVYSVLFIYCLRNTSEKLFQHNAAFAKVAAVLAVVFPVAACCDAIENFGLLKLLLGSQNELWVVVAYYCAAIKFCIIAISLVCIVVGQLYAFIKR